MCYRIQCEKKHNVVSVSDESILSTKRQDLFCLLSNGNIIAAIGEICTIL